MLAKLGRYIRDHHVGFLALVIAMSGTGYAATSLPRDSVGTRQLRDGAVTSSKIKPGALARGAEAGPRGPRGPRGRRGPRGPRGRRGFSGVVGKLTVNRIDLPLADNSGAAGSVACPSGQRAIGGSANVAAAGSADVNVTVSRPALGSLQLLPGPGQQFDRWRGAAVNPAGGTGSTTLRVWAICAQGAPPAAPPGGPGGD